jgi:glycosyltransferase involved in cell wall biosynthesis
MKMLLVNTYDVGGAAKACLRLYEGLVSSEVETKLLVRNKTNFAQAHEFLPSSEVQLANKIKNKLIRIAKELKFIPWQTAQERRAVQLQRQRKGLEMFSLPVSSFDLTQSPLYQEADIINLHWVANFLDWKTFFAKNTKPIVWTLHDQNPFLGIEHYAERFNGIDENGLPIPRKYTDLELKESAYWLNYKKNCLKHVKNLHIVSPSKWLLDCSQNSELFAPYPHSHIPNGFPTDIFRPIDQIKCRELLNLPLDKKIILFAADIVENSRKGFAFLQKALEKIQNENILLCAIGSKIQLDNHNNIIALGRIVDERLMAIAYAAADVFVIPSLEDNFPNTMIEALLCGTPVIGFATGGITDAIQHGENGYLCQDISVQSLQNNISKFLASPNAFDRTKIAQKAKEKYALEVQAKKYLALYQSIYTQST